LEEPGFLKNIFDSRWCRANRLLSTI